jgi:hypothetical protein
MIPPEDFVKFSLGEGVNHPANLRSIAKAFGREMREMRDGMLGRIEGNGREFWY